MTGHYLAVTLIASLAAGAAYAQNQSSSSSTTYQTPVGPVTHHQSSTPVGNGSYTTHTVSPGSGSTIQPYVGSTTLDPYPNNSPSTTTYGAGIVIPIGSSPNQGSGSPANPAPRGAQRGGSATPR